jgi:hypothetical protein
MVLQFHNYPLSKRLPESIQIFKHVPEPSVAPRFDDTVLRCMRERFLER